MDRFGDTDSTSKGDAIVDMKERKDRARFAPLDQIEGYWNALRGNRALPLRSEIDPRGLKGALEFCFVLERIAPGLARLRVAGSHLGDLMGMEVRGMPISSFLASDSRQEFGTLLEEIFETPATATITLSAETGFGRPPMTARMLLMPVRSDLGDASRILGGFMTDGDVGRVPRRFKIDKVHMKPIMFTEKQPEPSTATRLRPDDFRPNEKAAFKRGVLQTPEATKPLEAAEAGSTYEQPIPGVPYLRVVK